MKKISIIAFSVVLLFITSCEVATAPEETVTLESISVEPASITNLQISDSATILVEANYSDGTSERITQDASFSANSIVSIDGNEITALLPGTETLTVSYEGQSTDLSVSTVENYLGLSLALAASPAVPLTSINSTIGESYTVEATITYADGTTEVITPEDGLVYSDSDTVIYNDGDLNIVDSGIETLTATFWSQSVSVELDIAAFDFGTRRYISDSDLLRRAVSYSGYREGQGPDDQIFPTEAEIFEDLQLLEQAGFGFLRLYDTGTHARRTLKVIKDNSLDFKIMLGVWINEKFEDENWVQINGALELTDPALYGDIISAVSVGNECMVDWNSWAPASPEYIKKAIQYIRSNISQPVTTDENWEPFSTRNKNDNVNTPYETLPVAQVVDFLSIHTYPIADSPWGIWDWEQHDVAEADRAVAMMDAAITLAKEQYQEVRDNMDTQGLTALPIVIGETGWKWRVTGNYSPYQAHPANAAMYYQRMMDWTYGTGRGATPLDGPMACFYFEAFDEPWKSGDDGWGFFDKDRQANYVLYSDPDSYFYDPEYTVLDPVYAPNP